MCVERTVYYEVWPIFEPCVIHTATCIFRFGFAVNNGVLHLTKKLDYGILLGPTNFDQTNQLGESTTSICPFSSPALSFRDHHCEYRHIPWQSIETISPITRPAPDRGFRNLTWIFLQIERCPRSRISNWHACYSSCIIKGLTDSELCSLDSCPPFPSSGPPKSSTEVKL